MKRQAGGFILWMAYLPTAYCNQHIMPGTHLSTFMSPPLNTSGTHLSMLMTRTLNTVISYDSYAVNGLPTYYLLQLTATTSGTHLSMLMTRPLNTRPS